MDNKRYSIGQVEKICKIGKKTLRFYDKIGLLSPYETNENGYRYYNKDNLHTIPVIKYYKQSGFTLEKIKELIYNSAISEIEDNFGDKIKELELIEEELNLKKKSIQDWYSLVKEARMVSEYRTLDIRIKFLEEGEMIYLEQEYDYDYDYVESVINIDFTNYVGNIENAITGPVIIEFPSFYEKLEGKCKKMKIIQKPLRKCNQDILIKYGGHMVISAYHIGTHENINETYERLKKWMEVHNYKCAGPCFERYVIDYWCTKDETKFVTEIMVKFELLCQVPWMKDKI